MEKSQLTVGEQRDGGDKDQVKDLRDYGGSGSIGETLFDGLF
jgi:hypothetical protein